MNEDGLTALDGVALLGVSRTREASVDREGSASVGPEGSAVPAAPSPVLHPLFFGKSNTSKNCQRKFEQPWHRIALHLLAQGEDKKTVAELCDRSPNAVMQLCCVPWFQTMLAEEIRERTGHGMVELFQADVAMARSVENELLANAQTPPTIRASIAKTKIERVYGKAKQLVEFDNVTSSSNPVAEAEELERSIARDTLALFPPPSGQS
jgi:hypothetical protein